MANEKRLIDAYKLEDLLRSNAARYHHKDDVIAAIAGQPTVDAVEVVRCNNCHNCTKSNWCNLLMMEVKGDNFCSYGERKTDNGRS